MKRIISIILVAILCTNIFPLAAFAEEAVLYKSQIEVVSTENGYGSCEVYFCDNDCYMYIDDIVQFTRSSYVVDGDILKVNHGTRKVNIDLSTNTLTEDGISSKMKTLRNGDSIVVHAYPMLTYMGASCSVAEGKLLIDMPECTLWEGIIPTGNENDVTVEIFGDEAEQKNRLILNGILSILQSDLAHASGTVNRREAALLTTQIELSDYITSWDRKTSADQKQIDLFSKAVELGEFTEDWEDGFDSSETVYGITLHAVENTLDNPKLFNEFKDCWEADMKVISTGFVLLKNLSNNKKSAEDAAAIFNACSKYISSESPFYRTVTGLKDALYNDTSKNVGAVFYTGLESLLNEGFDKMLELGGQELSLSLGAGVLITDLLDGKEDAFAYATAETNAINLLYLKQEVSNALKSLADKILTNNYSNQQDIEDYRLLMSLYYRILIATNEQVEETIVAQNRNDEPEMAELISQLRANSTVFAQNLYVLTSATGKAFPNIEDISTANKWDEDNSIKANAQEVPNGIEGIGASSMKAVLTGIEADSIQYYNCSESGNFAVIEKNGKYGIIGYDGNLILPIKYDRISRGGGYSYDFLLITESQDSWGSYVDKDGNIAYGYPDGGDVRPSSYWYDGGVVIFNADSDVMKLEEFLNHEWYSDRGLKTAGLVLDLREWNSDRLFPVQKISGYTNHNGYYHEPHIDTMQFALMDMNTHKLISDFIYEGVDDYNGVSEGLLAVKKDGKWGFVNEEGTVVVDCLYDPYESYTSYGETYEFVYTAVNGHIAVLKDGKWGLLDTQGNTVIEASYDGISQVNPDGMFWLKEKGEWSLYQIN